MQQADITVVGGGVVAAAAVLAGLQHGLRVHHLQSAYSGGGGRHYALSRRSARFLQAFDADMALLPVRQFVLHAAARRLVLEDGDAPLCYMAAEEQLMQALSRCLHRAGVVSATADEIRYTDSSEETVSVCADSSDYHSALLVAADGARSPLARQLGIYGDMIDFNQQAVVGTVRTDALPPASAMQWFSDNDIVALLPMADGVFSLVWSTACVPQDITAALQKRIGISKLTVDEDSIHSFPLRAVTRSVRVAPRVALIGDAAGVIHPLAGQGLNLGLADVETLLQCTHRRINNNLSAGLAAYSFARRRRHQQLQQITQFVLPHAGRTAALFDMARLPFLRQFAVAFANA